MSKKSTKSSTSTTTSKKFFSVELEPKMARILEIGSKLLGISEKELFQKALVTGIKALMKKEIRAGSY